MPLPSPKKKEKRSEFVSRCVSELSSKDEFKDSKQRVAVCYDIFKKKESEASIVIGEGDDTQLFFEESSSKQLEKDVFDNPQEAMKRAKELGLSGIHSHENDGMKIYMPGKNHEDYEKAIEESKALQYGKPSKDDPRKTPAPKEDRKKGSDKNPEKSAEKANPKIEFSKETEEQLSAMVKDHNEKDKGSKASIGMLKTVYRRGAGAFSTSHAPNMSRHGWAIARVKAFLYLLRNGKPSNPNYKQDNDLLPKGHPKSS